MMNEKRIIEIAVLEQAASPAPWHVTELSDDACMSAVTITKNPSKGREYSVFPEWIPEDVVAACLVQSPELANVDDRRSHENALLIAAMRNELPELLRLAKLGLAVETGSQQP
jgi:hypothetical protein